MDDRARSGWWSRNWKWMVPVLVLTPLLICGGLGWSIMALVFGVIKDTDVYREAIARVRADGAVVSALGGEIEEGFFVSGNVTMNANGGQADLKIPISGPDDSASVHAVADLVNGKWTFTTLDVQLRESGVWYDVLIQPDPPSPSDRP